MPDRPTPRVPKNAWRFVLPLLFVAAGAAVGGREPEFAFRGQPIPPQCLAPFSTGGAERPPSATVVDLAACAASAAVEASSPAWESAPDGRRTFRRVVDGREAGAFGYRSRGRTSDGLSVLEIWDSDGGSGTYTEVLLVRREESRLVLVGSIPGGDRCTAGISAAAVQGRDVTVDFRLGAADLVGLASDLAAARNDETPELDLGAGTPYDCEGAARYRYAPATSAAHQLLGIDYKPSKRVLRGDTPEARCLRRAFGTTDTFLDRPALRRASQELRACLEADGEN